MASHIYVYHMNHWYFPLSVLICLSTIFYIIAAIE